MTEFLYNDIRNLSTGHTFLTRTVTNILAFPLKMKLIFTQSLAQVIT